MALRHSQSTSDELQLRLSREVSTVREMCGSLKAISAGVVKPTLQLMYFGAAALAQGECSLFPLHTVLPIMLCSHRR